LLDLCGTITSSAASLDPLRVGENGKGMIQDNVHGPYGQGLLCALQCLMLRFGSVRIGSVMCWRQG
jgi:hypothetical protein